MEDLIAEAVLLPSHTSYDRHKCPCSHTEHTHAHIHTKREGAGDGGERDLKYIFEKMTEVNGIQ